MIFRLGKELSFPDPSLANDDGLLAVGGDLLPERLLLAYRHGIFPWPSDEKQLLWYSPHERFVLFPEKLIVSSGMNKILKENKFEITINHAFEEVIHACAKTKRKKQRGTWITHNIEKAYVTLHSLGYAISVEAWKDGKLAGGLYGVVCGEVFCGESMFTKIDNASKAAFIYFIRSSSFRLIDCQVHTVYLESLGAEMISRKEYMQILEKYSRL